MQAFQIFFGQGGQHAFFDGRVEINHLTVMDIEAVFDVIAQSGLQVLNERIEIEVIGGAQGKIHLRRLERIPRHIQRLSQTVSDDDVGILFLHPDIFFGIRGTLGQSGEDRFFGIPAPRHIPHDFPVFQQIRIRPDEYFQIQSRPNRFQEEGVKPLHDDKGTRRDFQRLRKSARIMIVRTAENGTPLTQGADRFQLVMQFVGARIEMGKLLPVFIAALPFMPVVAANDGQQARAE